jgi:lipoate-protein ligase A
LHHYEWTYSCVLPPGQRLVRHPYDLYDLIHETAIAWFRDEHGIHLAQREQSQRQKDEPALCFLREDSHDVCCGGVKVLGSAQRRRKGALLQHGSLVLRRSELAPQVAGVNDLVSHARLLPDEGVSLARKLAASVGETVVIADLTVQEHARAEEIVSR